MIRQLFHSIVIDCYAKYLGMDDQELTTYVADMLTDFSALERPVAGQALALDDVAKMLFASDPVYGSARSFDAERAMRRQIGDYALFHAGMYPELIHAWPRTDGQSFLALMQAGKDSYQVVSQFNVFEYAAEAGLFGRLAENFEACVYGLNQVRRELQVLHLQGCPVEQLRLA